MTLAADVTAALPGLRAEAEAMMTATANVFRPVGEPTFNVLTNAVSQPVIAWHTGLKCKIAASDRSGQSVQAAETEVRVVDLDLRFPVGTAIAMGDLVTITASQNNPLSVGRTYRISDVVEREWPISRRCTAEEFNVPLSWEGP